jgi:hypothetical protein
LFNFQGAGACPPNRNFPDFAEKKKASPDSFRSIANISRAVNNFFNFVAYFFARPHSLLKYAKFVLFSAGCIIAAPPEKLSIVWLTGKGCIHAGKNARDSAISHHCHAQCLDFGSAGAYKAVAEVDFAP